MRVLATIAFSFAAGLFLVLLLPWSGWYLWAAAGLALITYSLEKPSGCEMKISCSSRIRRTTSS